MSDEQTVVIFGGAVKALGDGRVGGYLVRFGSPEQPDLTGDYFTTDTDFGDVGKAAVYYAHGMDDHLKRRKLGAGDMRKDDVGVWIEAQLSLRDDYERAVYALAEKGKLGWSSGTAGHLVEREAKGKAFQITSWPLGLDASLTPTPAEPRTQVIPLKSWSVETIKTEPEPEAEAGAEPAVTGEAEIKSIEVKKMELTQEQLDTLIAQAGKAGADAAIKNLPAINSAGVAVTHDEADTPFKSLGDQLEAVKMSTVTQGRDFAPRLKALNVKAALGANELVGAEGGFLLEPSFAAEILKPVHDMGPFSSRAYKLPLGPKSNGVTVNSIDETSRAAGSRWGGVLGYRLNEAGTKTASLPTLRQITFKLKKFAVLMYATDEILQDQIALASILQQGASEELDFMVNDDILNGLGAAGPLGILNSPCLVTVAKEAGQAADTIVVENIYKMWSRMHPRSKPNGVWFINSDVTPQLYALSLSVGTGGQPMYMAPGSLPNAPAGSLLGRPVVETEFNDTLGDLGDIVFADMTQYAMIDRDVASASSIHVQFLTDQTAFRFVYRVDGQPKWASALTPYKSSNTLSPFVTLAERA